MKCIKLILSFPAVLLMLSELGSIRNQLQNPRVYKVLCALFLHLILSMRTVIFMSSAAKPTPYLVVPSSKNGAMCACQVTGHNEVLGIIKCFADIS